MRLTFLKLKDNIVISGKGKSNLKLNNFIIEKEEEFVNDFYLNNWIETNFLFLDKKYINFLLSLNIFKYYGQDLFLLATLIKNNINIYSCPSNFYNIKEINNLEKTYSMIELYFNYNNAIKYLKQNRNQLKIFEIDKGIDINELSYLPFNNTGVEYSNIVSDLDERTNKYFPINTVISIKERDHV